MNQPVTAIEAYRPQNQLATWTPTFAVSPIEMQARVQAKHDFFQGVMRKGEHYGLPPGMEKPKEGQPAPRPALLKSGAELLLSSMGLFAELSDAETPIRDYDGSQNGGEALIAYRRICRIYRQTGPTENERVRVVQAEGFCSSRETKYRYREGGRKCPSCGSPAIIKGREDFGGGWLCFAKKGGCGDKFPAEDARILSQQLGRVPNPDIADQENTILKMADKRAYVAATLLATGCSDIFTQDIEDDPRFQDEPKDVTPRNNNRNDAPPQSSEPVGDGLIQSIKSMWGHLSQQEQWAMVIKATGGKARDIERATAEQGAAIYNELRKNAPQTHAVETPPAVTPPTPAEYIASTISRYAIPEDVISSLWSDLIGDARENYPTWDRGEVDMLRDFGKAMLAWVKAQREQQTAPQTQAEPTLEQQTEATEEKAETPEDALDKDLDSFASPKVAEQMTRSTIDPQIIENLRGMRPPHAIKLLCVTAEGVGLSGQDLRDIVKKAIGDAEVLTQVTYDKVMSTLQQMPRKTG